MNCSKCNQILAEGTSFCPYCGQKQEPIPVAQEPVKTAKYVTGDMPEPEIRFSKNLKDKTSGEAFIPDSQRPLYQPSAPAPVVETVAPPAPAAPVFTPPVEEKPVFTPPAPAAPVFTPPVEEKPVFTPPAPAAPVFTPPVEEKPVFTPPAPAAPVFTPTVEEKPVFMPSAPAEITCAGCGATLKATAKFCYGCGRAVSAPEQSRDSFVPQPPKPSFTSAPPSAPVPPSQATQQPKSPNYADGGAVYGQYYNKPQTPPVKQPIRRKPAEKKPGNNKLVLILAIVALVAVIGVVVAGILLGWFGGGKPLTTIYDATSKTLYSGGFEAEFTVEVPDVGAVSGTANCILDVEERELTALVELNYQGQTIRIGVLDGIAVLQQPNGAAMKVDISDYLDLFFDELEEDMTFEEALELGVELAVDSMGADGILDADAVIDCVDDSLNNASWLKENAGYTTKSAGGVTYHTFAPKLGNLCVALVEALEPAFEDEDMVDEALDSLGEGKAELNRMAKVEIALGVKGGKLVSLEADISMDGETMFAQITFDNIGSADVDIDEIEEMIDAAY